MESGRIDSVSTDLGLKTGDKILAVNDKPVTYFEDLNAQLLLGENITLERNGPAAGHCHPVNFIEKIVEKGKRNIAGVSHVIPASWW